jgi:hypothetical protein
MNAVISKHRKAVFGIAATLMLSGGAAFTIGAVAPDFASSFSANASEIVTGEKSAVSLVIEKSESGVGVLKKP